MHDHAATMRRLMHVMRSMWGGLVQRAAGVPSYFQIIPVLMPVVSLLLGWYLLGRVNELLLLHRPVERPVEPIQKWSTPTTSSS